MNSTRRLSELPAIAMPVKMSIVDRYKMARQQTEHLCAPLKNDDYNLQGMPDTSPPKWHLAHTTWFFETFVLQYFLPNYQIYHEKFIKLFNSYYNSLEESPYPRPQRGLLSRPTTDEIFQYRRAIDLQIMHLLTSDAVSDHDVFLQRIELGIQHEQQHQELLLTDIKYSFSLNPLVPPYIRHIKQGDDDVSGKSGRQLDNFPKLEWIEFSGGLCEFGTSDDSTFHFDNEIPRHRQFIPAYALADRLVTNAEFIEFINDGGYESAQWWLADGWRECTQRQWRSPLYWRKENNEWRIFTLNGERALAPNEPVCHVSYYEADAFSRWSDARLPTEYEWENAAREQRVEGNFVEDAQLHPRVCPIEKKSKNIQKSKKEGAQQLFGYAWEWTASPYVPYPGYIVPNGPIGEYNGKFMCNQIVLRGGSCVSPRNHLRATYRNFFYPVDRWQFSGIRLAKTL